MATSFTPLANVRSITNRPSIVPVNSENPSPRNSVKILTHSRGHHHLRSFTNTTWGHPCGVLANTNVSSGVRSSNKEVAMVDPLEAKRLADKQMQELKAKEKLERRRQIEAINGAWAMIGVTVGIVIEGHTGKGILAQLGGYWHAITSFFVR